MPEGDFLARFRGQTQFGIARQVLPKVDHGFAVGRFYELAREALLLQDGHAFGGSQMGKAEVPHSHAVPTGNRFQPCVIILPDFQVVFPDRPLLGGFPILIAQKNRLPVHFQLAEQSDVGAAIVSQSVHAHAAAIPAVAQNNGQFVFARFQQLGHIVALHGQALAVIPGAGSQHKIAYPLPVQISGIQTMAGDVQACAAGRFCSEPSAQIGCGLLFFRVMMQFRVDPFCLPGGQSSVSDHPVKTSHGAVLYQPFLNGVSIQLNRL